MLQAQYVASAELPICGSLSKCGFSSIWPILTRAGWSHFHGTLFTGVFSLTNMDLITNWRKIRLISGFRHFPFSSPQPTGCRSGRTFSRGALNSNTRKTITTASRTYSYNLLWANFDPGVGKDKKCSLSFSVSGWQPRLVAEGSGVWAIQGRKTIETGLLSISDHMT